MTRSINNIGVRLKFLRKRLKLKQQYVADYIEVNVKQIQRYESGENDVPLRNMKLYCDLFKMDLKDLFGDYESDELRLKDTLHELVMHLEQIKFHVDQATEVAQKNLEIGRLTSGDRT